MLFRAVSKYGVAVLAFIAPHAVAIHATNFYLAKLSRVRLAGVLTRFAKLAAANHGRNS